MEPVQTNTQQQVNTTDAPKQDTQKANPQNAEVSKRQAVSAMDMVNIDALIKAGIAAAPVSGEQADLKTEEKKEEKTEEESELPLVRFSVNDTVISGRVGDTVSVPPIHLFPGLTLDMSGASVMIIGVNNGVAQAMAAGGGARAIITMGTSSAYTQILEVPASDIVLSGPDQVSATAEGDTSLSTPTESSELFGFIDQLALILPGKETDRGTQPMGDVLVSAGGRISMDGIVCTAGCRRIGDGAPISLNSIAIRNDGIFADDEPVYGLNLTAPAEEKAEELADELDAIVSPEGKGDSEEKKSVNLLSGDVLDLLLEIFRLGPAALANKKLFAKLALLDIKDEEEESLFAAFKALAIKKGIKIADQAWKDRKHFKSGGKTSVKDWFRGLWYGTRQGIVYVLQDAQKLSKYTKETIKSLESLGIPTGWLKKIDGSYTDLTKSGADWMSKKLKVPNEPQKEEKEDDKKLEAELKILPGLLTVKLSLSPKVNLTLDGNTDVAGTFDQFVFGITGSGELGLDLGAAVDVGNAIIAMEAAATAGATFEGGLDGAQKIFDISGFTIRVISNEGENPFAQVEGDAHLDLMVNLKLFLQFGLSATSEVIGWGKELYKKRIEGVAASVGLNEDVYKRGNIMSIHGWHTRNGSITTSFMNGAKSEAMKLEGAGENNIGGVSDFLKSMSGRKEQLQGLDKTLESLNAEIGDVTAMVFSSETESSNRALADRFDSLLEAYKAVINLSERDIRRIDNMIEQYKNHMLVQDGNAEFQKLIDKRDARIRWVNDYMAEHSFGLESNKITRADVLRAYDRAFPDRGGGYARTDRDNREKQAQDQIYNANAIMAYEKDRISEKRKVRQSRIDQLQEILDENPNISTGDFLEKYTRVRSLFNDDKGIRKHILEEAVGLGFTTPVELKRDMEKYERGRVAVKKAEDLYTFINENEEMAADTGFDSAFNKGALDADKKAWISYVYKKCSVDDLIRYEHGSSLKEAGKDEAKKNRLEAIEQLRDIRDKYNSEEDPDNRKYLLNIGKGIFNSDKIDEETRKGLFDVSNRYKTLSAEKLREQIKTIGSEEGYIRFNVGKEGESIRNLRGDDPELLNRELTSENNLDIYKDYVKHVIEVQDYSSPVFSIQNILDYEGQKIEEYKSKRKSSGNLKHLAGHEERHSFLENQQQEITELGKISQTDAAQATTSAIEMYFSGVRPQGYYDLNAQGGEKIDPDTLRADVSKASGYLKLLKDPEKTPPTREGMLHALEWYIKRDSVFNMTLMGRKKASAAVEDLKTQNTKEIYDKWKSKLEVGANENWINAGLDAVTEKNYDLDQMINYLTYSGGDDKHFARYNGVREMQANGKTDDEIKAYYTSVLDGTRFAELAAEDQTMLGNVILSPAEFIGFYRNQAGLSIVFDRSSKHKERIKKIQETPEDPEAIEKLVRWYTEDEGGIRFAHVYMNRLIREGKITPEKIMEYERAKAKVGSRKHDARMNSMKDVFAQLEAREEEAKLNGRPPMTEEEKRRFLEENILAVYGNSQNRGGAGFEGARFKAMDLQTEAIAESRTGTEELKSILDYETGRKAHWEKAKNKLAAKLVELEKKKNEATEAVEAARQKIESIGRTLQVIREGTENLNEAKNAIGQAGRDVDVLTQTDEAVDDLNKSMEEVNAIEDEGKKEIEKIYAEAEEEDRARRENAG